LLGFKVGELLGPTVGLLLGSSVGLLDGSKIGKLLGTKVGIVDTVKDGFKEVLNDGIVLGFRLGISEGPSLVAKLGLIESELQLGRMISMAYSKIDSSHEVAPNVTSVTSRLSLI
jgi:hypothetical protein